MTLLPPPAIAVGIIAALAIPLLLVVLRVAPAPIAHPGARIRTAAMVALGILIAGLSLLVATGLRVDGWDALAALAILGAGVTLAFIPWSVIAWGFTMTMLLRLADSEASVDLQGWARRYAGPEGIRGLSRNRLAVLLALGLVREVEPDRFAPTERGAMIDRLRGLACGVFGLGPRR